MKVAEWLSSRWFNLIHSHNLVYNTCWEDPRLDRVALQLGPHDVILMITSAGCNALDYALQGPRHIYCVDMNPRQNALLELKMAGIRQLDFKTFYQMFGNGRLRDYRDVYEDLLRQDLSPRARAYWDKRIQFFSGQGRRDSFYFHGTAGMLAWLVNVYIDKVARIRDLLEKMFECTSVEEQYELYHSKLSRVFWNRFLRWLVDRDATLSFLGVPRAQRLQIDRTYPGGTPRFIEDRIEAVFTKLPLHDNYFWRVYLQGRYTPQCCPEYLKPDNFARLKAGLVDRMTTCTSSILDFLRNHRLQITRFVLLDHMDWLSTHHHALLCAQWQALLDRATPGARLLWRSGGLRVDYVDPIPVRVKGRTCSVGDVLHYHRELAAELHPRDRVHTYGSFYIADFVGA